MGIREHHGRTDLRKAGMKRLLDAEALLRAGRSHCRAAQYLAGYAIECKLKAVAMEAYDCFTLEELARRMKIGESQVYTHGLEALASRLPMYARLRSSLVWKHFTQVNLWRPSWRYDPKDATEEDAANFLDSVRQVYNWLEGNR